MPSPILHMSAGLALCCLDRPASQLHRQRVVGFILLAAILPDVDFLIGLLMGEPNRFHGGLTHSLGGAVVAGFGLGILAGERRSRVGLLCFLSYASHVILDSLTRDSRPLLGVPLLWPLTRKFFNFPLIPGIRHGLDGASVGGFLREVLSLTNLRTLAVEGGIGSVLVLVSLIVGSIRRQRKNHSASFSRDGKPPPPREDP